MTNIKDKDILEYINGSLCISGKWLYDEGDIMSKSNYNILLRRKKLNRLTMGGNGRRAMIDLQTMPKKYRAKVYKKLGNPFEESSVSYLATLIRNDAKAGEYYANYKLENDDFLPLARQIEYKHNVEVLNAVIDLHKQKVGKRKAQGASTKGIWQELSDMVNVLDSNRYKHSLPSNYRRLKERANKYVSYGYASLIHGSFGNKYSRKVTAQIENLILALFCMPEKPFAGRVHELYIDFIEDRLELFDAKTGEIFNSADFRKNGKAIVLSKATIWNYYNNPLNRNKIDAHRKSAEAYRYENRPHAHRHDPYYSLSLVSIDDRDIMSRVSTEGKVMAYYAFDRKSKAIIGYSHSLQKDMSLLNDCMTNMMRWLHYHNIGFPMQMEVEHHLVNKHKDGLFKAGVIFPQVRWCLPGNSQEKYAERLIGVKKYGKEKEMNGNVGRHYSKLVANRVYNKKVFDEKNNTYVDRKAAYAEIVADDVATINAYNAELHPDQKTYKGMSKMAVFFANLNPQLPRYQSDLVAYYLGEKRKTTIRRSQYVNLMGDKYMLSSPSVLGKLEPNNYSVTAHWLMDKNGEISEVYLFQGERYIDTCKLVERFNAANSEWTSTDIEKQRVQAKYVAEFDKMTKEAKVAMAKVRLMPSIAKEKEVSAVVVADVESCFSDDFSEAMSLEDKAYYAASAVDEL